MGQFFCVEWGRQFFCMEWGRLGEMRRCGESGESDSDEKGSKIRTNLLSVVVYAQLPFVHVWPLLHWCVVS